MYATNNGTTNKAPNNNSTTMFDNTITVTPIKMELTDTSVKGNVGGAAGQRRPNAVIVSSQQLAMPMQTGIQVSNSVSGNNYTGITVTSMTTTGPTPKEKPSKAARVQVTRKPPPTIENFWPTIISEVNNIGQVDAKHQVLPLARIKKIMKLDENAKMIAGEAPLLFAKACEYFIQELTMRAWVHTEESRRRTLQRSDIAQAIANYDQFDFLIDIVPREEIKPSTTQKSKEPNSSNCIGTTTASVVTAVTTVPHCNNVSGNFVTGNVISTGSLPAQATTSLKLDASAAEVLGFSAVNPELFAAAAVNSSQQLQQLTTHQQHQPQQVQIIQPGAGPQQLQYFIALPGQQPTQLVQQLQHHQQQQQQQQQNSLGLNIVTQQPTQQLILTAGPNGQLTATPAPTTAAQQQQQQTQVLLQNLAQQQQHQQQQQQQQQIQLLQQVVTPTGELTNVP
ncbi:Nf-YC, partial [Drosophila busckii]